MKKYFLLITLFVSLAYSQEFNWTKLEGPYGGYCSTLFTKGDTLITIVSKVIYFSTNGGKWWIKSNSPDLYTRSFVYGKDSSFICATDMGIYKSKDLISWEKILNGSFFHMATDNDGNIYTIKGVYQGFSTYQLYKSTDFGISWVSDYTFNDEYPFLLISNNYIFISGKNKIRRRDINSMTWEQSIFSYYNYSISLSFDATLNCIYAIGSGSKLLSYSIDEGSTWNHINIGDYYPNLSPENLYTDKGVIFISHALGNNISSATFIISTDKGGSWSEPIFGFPAKIRISDLKSAKDGFIASSGYGIVKTTDNGRTWFDISYGINETRITKLIAISGEEILISTYYKGIMYTSDNGRSWEERNTGLPGYKINNMIRYNNEIYISSWRGLFKSFDNGNSWREIPSPFTSIVNKLFLDNNKIYVFSYYSLYVSDDGNSWREIYNMGGDVMGVVSNSYGDLFIATLNGERIYRKPVNSNNWQIVLHHASFSSAVKDVQGNMFFPSSNGLLKSSDNGSSFDTIIFGSGRIGKIFTDNNRNYFATVWLPYQQPSSFYYSNDEGVTWENITGNLNGAYVTDMAFANDQIILATDKGIFTTTKNDILQSDIATENSNNIFLLSQNYPNPFNPNTNIKFSIPNDGVATIKIFDILGKEIKTVVNEYKSAGNYEVDFNANNLPSGMYIYSLTSGNYSQNRKMLLMK